MRGVSDTPVRTTCRACVHNNVRAIKSRTKLCRNYQNTKNTKTAIFVFLTKKNDL